MHKTTSSVLLCFRIVLMSIQVSPPIQCTSGFLFAIDDKLCRIQSQFQQTQEAVGRIPWRKFISFTFK
ncbi:hypothetical protein M758_9G148400 [Ceratodon purpureus]|nr:hypothetical protein M758_9G148400 [Ceratodon purpureus]